MLGRLSGVARDSEGLVIQVGVVVPAHDDQATIGAFLDSVRTALALQPTGMPVAVSVALDRRSDRTPQTVAPRRPTRNSASRPAFPSEAVGGGFDWSAGDNGQTDHRLP